MSEFGLPTSENIDHSYANYVENNNIDCAILSRNVFLSFWKLLFKLKRIDWIGHNRKA